MSENNGIWRLIGAALVLGLLCTAGVLATLQADAQGRTPAAPAPATLDGSSIRDDPTVAPDVRESADDNVTFPTDI
jgi:hypothetical protein